MDKYIVKATVQLGGVVVVAIVSSVVVFALLEYFQPSGTTVIGMLMTAFLAYTGYNLVKIQADVLRSKDKLNNK